MLTFEKKKLNKKHGEEREIVRWGAAKEGNLLQGTPDFAGGVSVKLKWGTGKGKC